MQEIEKTSRAPLDSLAGSDSVSVVEPQILDITPDEDTPHLLDYWEVVLKRRWTLLLCLLVVFTTVAIGTLKKRPVYEGKVLIEIDPETPSVLNFKEVMQMAASNPNDEDTYRETQYRVLQSRSLAERVVNDLQLYRRPEFYQRWMLVGLFEGEPKQLPPASSAAPPDTSADYYRNSVQNFLDSVDVSPVRRSNLVEVSFYSRDPQLAAVVANKLADDYIEENLAVKWEETEKASNWLQGKLVDLKARLETAEDRLQKYAAQNSIVYMQQGSDKQDMATTRLQELLEEYTKAQADRFQKESLYSLVQQGKVQDLPGVLSNRLIQDLEEKLADLQKQYAQETAFVKPNYPRAQQLKKQIDAYQGQIEKQKRAVIQNISDDYQSALAREKYLEQAIAKQKQEVAQIAQRTIQYNILKRDVDSNKVLYDGLYQRMKEAQVSAGSTATNIRIVDSAETPKRPVRPRVMLNLFLGIILGLALGTGLAFFQDYLDKTLKTPDEVEKHLRLPSLGIVPRFAQLRNGHGEDVQTEALVPAGKVAVAPAFQTAPDAVEAFRSLRTSILLSANPSPRLILLTSALPGEGKTTTALNLGATLASLGSRVVVVDCDMRRPACHHAAGVKNYPGFVQCLTGHTDMAQAILPVPGVPNLSVIPCGPIPPNPAEVLSAPITGELFRRLRSEFEYVLIDSPPLLSVADSRILATFTDAAVLVTRAFETPYDVVRRARTLLYKAGARILGVALNDVDLHHHDYSIYSHYRYGHGYGYGNEQERTSGSQAG